MASTSTNKQPLLIDRVFHNVVKTRGLASGSATSLDISGTNSSVVLVNCTGNDGAIIEDIYTLARSTKVYKVNLYLSTAVDFLRPEEANCVGQFSSSGTIARKTSFTEAPFILAPTPNIGGNAAVQYEAMYVPKGQVLWVSLGIATASSTDDTPIVGAQGGLY